MSSKDNTEYTETYVSDSGDSEYSQQEKFTKEYIELKYCHPPGALKHFFEGALKYTELSNDIVRNLNDGTLSCEQIEKLKYEIITYNECGATLRIIITKNKIDIESLTDEIVYDKLGWNDPGAFRAYGGGVKFSTTENYWGYEVGKIGEYYLMSGGFAA